MPCKRLAGFLALALGGFLLFPAGAQAAKQKAWQFVVDTPEQFAAAATALRQELGPDGRYAEASAADRAAVERDLGLMQRLIESRGTASRLPDQQQVDLANAQERINAILTRNDGDRMICTFERRTGSNFKEKICATARARQIVSEKGRRAWHDQVMAGGASQPCGELKPCTNNYGGIQRGNWGGKP